MKTSMKTKIALTASQHFDTVYPQVADIVDVIELRTLNSIPSAGKVERIVHLNGFINDQFEDEVNAQFLSRLNDYGIKSLSFDLGPSCEKVRMDDFYMPESAVLSPDRIMEIGKRRLAGIRSVYKGPVSMENLDYHKGGAYEHVCEPSFITRAVYELSTGLTLDIGHANVTAFNKHMDVKDYIGMLPLDRLTEVHISHAVNDDDAHDLPTDSDYDILEFIFSKANPGYIVVEYFRDPEAIVGQLRILHNFIEGQ